MLGLFAWQAVLGGVSRVHANALKDTPKDVFAAEFAAW
jgi:hypothetical protein